MSDKNFCKIVEFAWAEQPTLLTVEITGGCIRVYLSNLPETRALNFDLHPAGARALAQTLIEFADLLDPQSVVSPGTGYHVDRSRVDFQKPAYPSSWTVLPKLDR